MPEEARMTMEFVEAPPEKYRTPFSRSPSLTPVAAKNTCLHAHTPSMDLTIYQHGPLPSHEVTSTSALEDGSALQARPWSEQKHRRA